MCTVTCLHDVDGYELFCNRDEKLTRKKATSPRLTVRDGVRFVAPVDGDAGGAWVATNEFGVSISLLNGTGPTESAVCHPSQLRSRGLLVLDLISARSVAAICDHLQGADLARFKPFTLAAVELARTTALIEWDGSRKNFVFSTESCLMLTSSSFDAGEVRKRRQEEYRMLTNEGSGCDSSILLAFHESHRPARSAYSTCMHRPGAATVSFSRIRVSNGETDFFYSPGAPCEQTPGAHVKLAHRDSDY